MNKRKSKSTKLKHMHLKKSDIKFINVLSLKRKFRAI